MFKWVFGPLEPATSCGHVQNKLLPAEAKKKNVLKVFDSK